MPPSHQIITDKLRAAGCVFAEEEARLLLAAASDEDDLDQLVGHRVAGYPLEVLLRWAGFCGMRIAVEPGVFVPRLRSRFLVEQAVALAGTAPVVLDLCCGTGAIGVAIAASVGRIELHAADLDPAAVRCARRNIAAAGGRAYLGDLFDPLPADVRGRVDILTVNAPYVPTGEIAHMPPEARDHEPAVALDGGWDGLQVHRRVAASAVPWLAPGGHLLIETSIDQAPHAAEILDRHGLRTAIATSEDLDATVVLGRA